MTTQTETNEIDAAPQAFFEITTLDGAIYRKGASAPYGTVTTDSGANMSATVQSYKETGDWIDVLLSNGYAVGFHETRIARLVTYTD